MRSVRVPLRVNLSLDKKPLQIKLISSKKSNFTKYVTFISGSLLAISESLPFFDNINGNGVLHMLSSIQKEYKDEFGK